MLKVKVKKIPIRYGSKTYRRGETLEIEDKHYESISKYVKIVSVPDSTNEDTPEGEITADQIVEGDVFPIKKEDNGITEEYLENLPYNDLKTFLKNQGLNIGKRRKHSEILEFAKEQLLEG